MTVLLFPLRIVLGTGTIAAFGLRSHDRSLTRVFYQPSRR